MDLLVVNSKAVYIDAGMLILYHRISSIYKYMYRILYIFIYCHFVPSMNMMITVSHKKDLYVCL